MLDTFFHKLYHKCMDRFEISILRDFYGSLLTTKQDDMLKMRYDEDLSFGEIAEICNVSRQTVLDGINKGEKHLIEYEENLKCLEKQRRILAILDGIENDVDGVDKDEIIARLGEIRKILED